MTTSKRNPVERKQPRGPIKNKVNKSTIHIDKEVRIEDREMQIGVDTMW